MEAEPWTEVESEDVSEDDEAGVWYSEFDDELLYQIQPMTTITTIMMIAVHVLPVLDMVF